jgi:hypothetical protein
MKGVPEILAEYLIEKGVPEGRAMMWARGLHQAITAGGYELHQATAQLKRTPWIEALKYEVQVFEKDELTEVVGKVSSRDAALAVAETEHKKRPAAQIVIKDGMTRVMGTLPPQGR